jgi:hypothetical protein
MQLLKHGVPLLVGLVLASIACRKSVPPPIDICIGDGVGGADCILKDGTKAYLLPSQLKNYWMTSQFDMQAFSSWCYDTSTKVTGAQMEALKAKTQ